MPRNTQIKDYNLPLNAAEEEKLKKLADESANDGIDIKATIKIEKDKKITLKEDFVITYTNNLFVLFKELELTKNEMLIVAALLELMQYGNLLSFKQVSLAKKIGLDAANFSRNFKKLKNKKVIVIDNDGNMFMNSKLFQKGLSHLLSEERREHLKKANVNLFKNNNEEIFLDRTI